jgi:peptidoglycan hydrolase-like protein with peptidoglycan-binding domain
MRLNVFLNAKLNYGIEAIAADKELARNIQEVLILLRFLDPPADGLFGPISAAALKEFQEVMQCKEQGYLGPETAEKLIETSPQELPQPELKLGKDLVSSIMKYMMKKGYRIATGTGKYNIIYIEGINGDGDLNDDRPNEFNDRRLLIQVLNQKPSIIGNWDGTTEPGYYYTDNPMNPKGAARIAFGQYKAWQVGTHYGGGAEPHEALVQTAPITVYRDANRDMVRTGDKLDTGLFDINQHWGYDYPRNNISFAGAGCLVGRTRAGHREFMKLVKQDTRYQLNRNYTFLTTVIPGDELVKQFPF